MPKINFTKLSLKRKDEIKEVSFEGNIIEVKQYLPVSEKLELVEFVLNSSVDQNNFANPLKVEVFMNLAILYYYTNITFTEKQKEDAPKLFDLVEENGLIDIVISTMSEIEYNTIVNAVNETIDAYYKYVNSLYGIMDNLNSNYDKLALDAINIEQTLSNPENLSLLRDILTKLD